MNLQIYKYNNIHSTIEYFVFDPSYVCDDTLNYPDCRSEFPDDDVYHGLRISVEPDGLVSICSTTSPLSYLTRNATESSFLDLLVVTGLPLANLEFLFANFPINSYTISIRPRYPKNSGCSGITSVLGPFPGINVSGTSMNGWSITNSNSTAGTIVPGTTIKISNPPHI